MTIKNEKLTLQDVESMCKLAHEHKVAIEVTVRPEDYEVNISPWVPIKMEAKVTEDAPVAIVQDEHTVIGKAEIEALEEMMNQSIDKVVEPTIETV